MNRSSYYQWKKRSKSNRQRERERLIPLVKEIARKSKSSYGSRRISMALQLQGERCGRDQARTLMKLAGVVAKQGKKYKVPTDSRHNIPVAPSQFEVEKPNRV